MPRSRCTKGYYPTGKQRIIVLPKFYNTLKHSILESTSVVYKYESIHFGPFETPIRLIPATEVDGYVYAASFKLHIGLPTKSKQVVFTFTRAQDWIRKV